MTRDLVVLAVVIVAFATLLTVHLMIVLGLARRSPRWRALLALVVVPLAPLWGFRSRMRVRGALWVGAAIAYGVALCLARA